MALTELHRSVDAGIVYGNHVVHQTFHAFQGKIYRIGRADVRPGLRGGRVRIEVRLDGSIHARFQERYLTIEECQPQPRQQLPVRAKPAVRHLPSKPGAAARQSISGISRRGGMPVWKAARIDKTRG